MRTVGACEWGAVPLVCREGDARSTATGLPATPPAVRVVGRFPRLAALEHPHLCQYVDIARCLLVPNTVVAVSEHYERTLEECLGSLSPLDRHDVGFQIASAFKYLHENRIASGLFDVEMVLFEPDSVRFHCRLAQYGLSMLSGSEADVELLLASPFTLSPERLADPARARYASFKDDIWAMGIVFIQILVGRALKDLWSYKQYFSVVTLLLRKQRNGSLFDALLEAITSRNGNASTVDPDCALARAARKCLNIYPSARPIAEEVYEMLKDERIEPIGNDSELDYWEVIKEQSASLSSDWVLSELPMREAFFLWKLCGSSVESLLIKHGVVSLQHPITTTPSLVVGDFRQYGNDGSRKFKAKFDIFVLPSKNFRDKMLSIDPLKLLYSFEFDGHNFSNEETLPVVVKEKDVFYQCSRMKMVKQLVRAVSFKEDMLRKLIAYDIPPMIRSEVWTALLGVTEFERFTFDVLDTVSPHTSDRQLEVDIPRCHQYEEMMTTPAAHAHLKRLLKAWLHAHPNFVYWQGLDSLAAPFLLLNFVDLRNALACMTSFVNKYLLDFFLQDNSAVIQEYLAVFNHLVAYVDAELYNCMREMDFYPELFAIPWFLTCFAHVLPLHKLFHVWDCLLLGDAHFPLCVGLAVLRQLRPRLIDATFNDAILLFSDLPDLRMEPVIADSQHYYSILPPSCAFRTHGSDNVTGTGPRHTMRTLSVRELKACDSPRMGREDLAGRVHRQHVLLIDTRSPVEFNRASILRSINFPNVSDGPLCNIQNLLDSAQKNEHPICILDGGRHEVAFKFAARLVKEGICGVCVLDGGFEGVRSLQDILKTG